MQVVINTDNFLKSTFSKLFPLTKSYLISNVKIFIFKLPNLFRKLLHFGKKTLLYLSSPNLNNITLLSSPKTSFRLLFLSCFWLWQVQVNTQKMDLFLFRLTCLLQQLRTWTSMSAHLSLVVTPTACDLIQSIGIFPRTYFRCPKLGTSLLSYFIENLWPVQFTNTSFAFSCHSV